MNPNDLTGFADLNIAYNPDDKLLERIVEFDYRVIALNWTVDVSNMDTSKKATKKKKDGSSSNSDVTVFPNKLAKSYSRIISRNNYSNLKVFLRITITFSSPEQLKFVLSSPEIKHYDLIAVLPINNAAYDHACSNQSVDLISFEIGVTNYKPNGKLHKILVNRKGFFEISYSQALKSSTKRQDLFTMTQYFSIYGKSKNAIISSGASHFIQLRNPFDVANLGLLFGLKEVMAKAAVSDNCRMLLLVAAGKKYGKTAITVNLIEDQEPCRKKAKLGSGDNVAEVTDSISSLTTAEQH